MKTKLTNLSNGLPLLYRSMPAMETVGVVFAVNYGSVYERKETNGCAHFLEHMLFRGTQRRTNVQIKDELDTICGSNYWNGGTSKEHIIYYGRTHKSLFLKLMDVLSDMVINSKLEPKDVEIERGAILNENLMRKDETQRIAFYALYENLFGEHPAAMRTIGDNETIQKLITRDVLSDTYKSYYTPDNSVLSICGAIEGKQIRGASEKLWSGLNGKFSGVHVEPAPVAQIDKEIVIEKAELNQAMVAIGMKLPEYKKELQQDNVTLDLLNDVLTRNLMIKIREEKGMAYSISAYASTGLTHSALQIYIGTQPENVNEVKNLALKEMQAFADGEISEKVAKNKKAETIRNLKIGIAEGTIGNARSAASEYLISKNANEHEELPAHYQQITLDDLRRVGSLYMNPIKSLKVVVKPKA